MKKIIALLLAACMLFALAGCSVDSIITSAENKVVNTFGIDASGDEQSNISAFAANSCLVLLDAFSAAEQMRGFISCAQGYFDAAGTLSESTGSAANVLEQVKQAYAANEGRSYEALTNSLNSAVIGLENLKLTLPARSSACRQILERIDTLVALLNEANGLISTMSESSLTDALGKLSSFESISGGLYEYISQFRLDVTDSE